MEGMDCADCARHVEEAARSLPGVAAAQVSFASGKLFLVVENPQAEKELERVLRPMGTVCSPRASALGVFPAPGPGPSSLGASLPWPSS